MDKPSQNEKNRDWIAPANIPGVKPEDYPKGTAPGVSKPDKKS